MKTAELINKYWIQLAGNGQIKTNKELYSNPADLALVKEYKPQIIAHLEAEAAAAKEKAEATVTYYVMDAIIDIDTKGDIDAQVKLQANYYRNRIGVTEEEIRKGLEKALAKKNAPKAKAETQEEYTQRMKKAKEYDDKYNEGAEGYNPYRRISDTVEANDCLSVGGVE